MSPLPPPMPSVAQLCNQHPALTKKRKVSRSFLSDDSVVLQTQISEDSMSPLPPPMPSVAQLRNQHPALTKKRRVCRSFLSDDSVVLQPQISEDSMSPLPLPMPSVAQLCNQHTALTKKRRVCGSFLSDDCVVLQPQISKDSRTPLSPLPPPMLSLSQPCKEHSTARQKWKVQHSFLDDAPNHDESMIPQYAVPSKKWKIPDSFSSNDSVQQKQNTEESVLCLPPMLKLTSIQYPDDSCVEGFAVSTPVLDGGYFPGFFPDTVDPPSPIIASSEQQLSTSPPQLKELDNIETQSQTSKDTRRQQKNKLAKQMMFKKRQSKVHFNNPSEEPIVLKSN